MFIRTTPTRNSTTGESYITHRLVESRRVGGKVRQVTLLDLGRQFPLVKERWPDVCARIEQLLGGQQGLLPATVMESVERCAQHCFARLVAQGNGAMPSRATAEVSDPSPSAFVEVDADSLELTQPRSIGVEHVALAAMPLSRLYRASALLMKHREEIESRLFARIEAMFELAASVTLYDLTNTCFEGTAAANAKAMRGRSQEKRSDCPLVTLGVVCDGSGFIRRSRVFAGNAVECRTLEEMLVGLGAPAGALVIMDRGMATAANLAWLVEHGYRYLVVSRERERHFDADRATTLVSAGEETIQVVRELSEDGQEVRLHCHSPGREMKESGIMTRFCTRFEAGLPFEGGALRWPSVHFRAGVSVRPDHPSAFAGTGYPRVLVRIARDARGAASCHRQFRAEGRANLACAQSDASRVRSSAFVRRAEHRSSARRCSETDRLTPHRRVCSATRANPSPHLIDVAGVFEVVDKHGLTKTAVPPAPTLRTWPGAKQAFGDG